jgi:hypothetical protein
VGEVVVRSIFPFPSLNLFDRGIPSTSARVADEFRFEEPDEVGFVSQGLRHRVEYLVKEDGMARGEGVGLETFVNNN